MKKAINFAIITLLFSLFTGITLAQSSGDFRSIKSGNWRDVSNWEWYVSSNWTTPSTYPGSSRNVTIQSGHTITLPESNSCNNLTIETGAVINSEVNASVTAYYLRVGGVAGSNAILQNDGLLGSTTGVGDGIILEAAANAASMTIQGNGICQVARLRAVSGNSQNFNMIINQDITLTVENAPAFTAFYNNSVSSVNDNYTFTINAGKTVKLLNPNSYFHISSSATAYTGGNYTYNINGTLDLSNTTVNANIIPNSANSLSKVNLNISGLVKLGTGLNLVNSSSTPDNGKVFINIEDGGLLDATKTTSIDYGNNFFKLAGTGAVKRKIDNTDVVFPIGLASSTEPNFVTLNNSGTETNFTVGLSPTFTVPPTETEVVDREWNIQPENAGAVLKITLGWGATAQATSFNPANPIALIHYNGTSWDESLANIITGPDVNNLYAAELTGVNDFGAFSIQNSDVLPLKLVNFTAKLNTGLTNTVDLNWQTQNEINTQKFIVERSVNGKDFNEIGFVKSSNTSGNHYYSYTDLKPLNGVSYYKLKQIDIDGKFEYSPVKAIDNNSTDFMIYPNPVASTLQITHPQSGSSDVIKIINNLGAVIKEVSPSLMSDTTSIDLSGLKTGVYLVCLQNNGTVSTSKFLKE